LKNVIFNLFILLTIVPSLWAAFSRSIVRAAFCLLFTFFGAAGLYVMLGADFIGLVQVVVYIGGILVLIIFGVMMTQGAKLPPLGVKLPGRLLAGVLSGVVLIVLSAAVLTTKWPQAAALEQPQPTAESVGDLLLGKYLIPFELALLLLLAALVGALLVVRRSVRED